MCDGAIRHSLGGHNSVYTAVFDDRLQVVVSSCGLDSYLDYYGGDEKNWQPEKGWCQTRYMRKLADYKGRLEDIPFDFHELIGALAPRHVLLIAPKKDANFRADSVDRIAAAARPVFQLLGDADHLQVEHPDGEHDFPPEMREAAYLLFDQVLGGKYEPRRPQDGLATRPARRAGVKHRDGRAVTPTITASWRLPESPAFPLEGMQTAATEAFDLGRETAETRRLDGLDDEPTRVRHPAGGRATASQSPE